MSDLEKRYIINAYNKMLREEKELKLCYRGTAYKKTVLNWSGDLWGVRFPPSVIGIGPLRRIPFAVMTVGKDHNLVWSIDFLYISCFYFC